MSVVNVKIKDRKIIQSTFNLPVMYKEKFELKATIESQLRESKNKSANTALLDLTFDMSTTNNDDFKIFLKTYFIFEFDNIPEDIDDITKNKFIPMAVEQLYGDIDSILVAMGHPPLHLSKNQTA